MAAAAVFAPMAALATNGMNMEGFGPEATAMGGASFAYDNGSAGMMNNPATLALMAPGNRLDLALGILGPDVKARAGGSEKASSGDAYYMPALGYLRKAGSWTFGAGVFAQGGMGTEFGNSSFLSAGTGKEQRSELSVGRLIFPLALQVNDAFSIGGSIDYVWAGLDLRMLMDAGTLGAMFQQQSRIGSITASPGFQQQLGQAFSNGLQFGYFDFSNGNDFTGAAKATGWAGKLGATYKISPALTLGATYHSKTSLGDLEADHAKLTMIFPGGFEQTLNGKMKIRDFQWPEIYGVGVAFKPMDSLMLAADYKRIGWKKVMKDFKMVFSSGGETLNAKLFQNWDDQDVFALGGAYSVNPALTLRAGFNIAKNPIPDANLNYLFPAIVKTHYTFGAGYKLNEAMSLDGSMVYAPKVSQTNPNTGVESSHAQLNWQIQLAYRF